MLLILTLPAIAPPLPNVNRISLIGAGLIVMCPFAHDRYIRLAVERDERELCQVDLVELIEDLLPLARIRCRQFLPVEGIQGSVAVEVIVTSFGWGRLVAREQIGIIGVIAKGVLKLGDIIPACHSSR